MIEKLQAMKEFRKAYIDLIQESYIDPSPGNMECKTAQVSERINAVPKIEPDGELPDSLIVLPTGAGKTGIIFALPFSLPLRQSRRVLVLTSGLVVTDEVKKAFSGEKNSFVQNLLAEKPHPRVKMIKELGQSRPLGKYLQEEDVVVANYQQLIAKKFQEHFTRDFFDLVIVDEGHHSEADSYRAILGYFNCAHKILLTATPFRGDDKKLNATMIHRTTIRECIQARYIKNLVLCNVPVTGYNQGNPPEKVSLGWEQVLKEGESKPTQDSALKNKSVRESVMKLAMECLDCLRRKTGEDYHQAIVQATNQKDARSICNQWRQIQQNTTHEFVIEYVTFENKKRDDVLQKLRNGEIDVIVHVGMLGEGFDHSRLSVAVVLSKIQTLSRFIQFVGRATRIHEKKQAKCIWDNVAFIIGHPLFGINRLWDAIEDWETGEPTSPPSLNWSNKKISLSLGDLTVDESRMFADGGHVERVLSGGQVEHVRIFEPDVLYLCGSLNTPTHACGNETPKSPDRPQDFPSSSASSSSPPASDHLLRPSHTRLSISDEVSSHRSQRKLAFG
mmetsp:Transcript_13466/g.31887  ORF Transcript_13466/g.31887 Transcript_13466/m.31887 type:complete len:560 (+) Transcript_13466:21-1700(+)